MTLIAISFARYALGILVGAMVFFPSVVAPLVFRTIGDEAAAGRFLRALFPRYYGFMIVASGVAAGALAVAQTWIPALVLTVIALSTLWVRQVLVPRINAHKDAGENAAFERGHKLSVSINMMQLLAAVVVMVMVA